ncbi:MAG: bifunctional phosphoribosylaminoimidazolecarboxamide formyltransferase/IMP cyclohydrolase [Elusimicrobiota bacterium]|nr:bifunctional phosphoribosylaminoimidazolecarboxamide formyltransferase/IMP cyclohydrolase [Elusimicrobiota bacterium]
MPFKRLTKVQGGIQIKRALISVSDKKGLGLFAKALASQGAELLATGGTYKYLKERKIPVKQAASEPLGEILSGRVKTLSREIFAGILADNSDASHRQQLRLLKIKAIELVCVTPYKLNKLPESIDIGGIALLRAAAKNCSSVIPVCDPTDYKLIIEQVKNKGFVPREVSEKLAMKVFKLTSDYDSRILRRAAPAASERTGTQKLRYGENPMDKAEVIFARGCSQISGKQMSSNNIFDMEAAYNIVNEFKKPACAVIKHRNASGAAVAEKSLTALKKAYGADPLSAWGGVYAFNRRVDKDCAAFLSKKFVECIVAPDFSREALAAFCRKNTVLFKAPDRPAVATVKSSVFGTVTENKGDLSFRPVTVTKKKAGKNLMRDLEFAWKIVKNTTSNAVVIAAQGQTLAVCGGAQSRVRAIEICGSYLKKQENMVLATDGFFPFDDSIKLAKKIGIKAIIQPGGSIRDAEVTKAADKLGMIMLFTGRRVFKH